jgi:hypothetical protein
MKDPLSAANSGFFKPLERRQSQLFDMLISNYRYPGIYCIHGISTRKLPISPGWYSRVPGKPLQVVPAAESSQPGRRYNYCHASTTTLTTQEKFTRGLHDVMGVYSSRVQSNFMELQRTNLYSSFSERYPFLVAMI